MSALRATIILILAGGASSAFAEQITCESRHDAPEACGTVKAGSNVTLMRQISDTPCVEGRNWGTGPDHDSIWVSGGCRAVFDVQSQSRRVASRSVEADRNDHDDQGEPRDDRVGNRAGTGAGQNENDGGGYSQDPPVGDRADNSRNEERRDGSRHASADRLRASARRACIDQAATGRSFGPDDVQANDVRWIGQGLFAVNLDTPDGALTCTVDRDGNVSAIDNR
jgi:Protein of unknown function (DUF3011)